MASTLESILNPTHGSEATPTMAGGVLELLDKYEHKVQASIQTSVQTTCSDGKHTVILTGSTGSLGCYLLAALLARADVDKVICLNRTADAKDRQSSALEFRDLPAIQGDIDAGRAIFLEASLDQPHLGLSSDAYSLLLQETTCVIHNAFPVHFLLSLRSFEPQLVGQLNLLALVDECVKKPSFLLISSIGAARRTNPSSEPIPEAIFPRHQAAYLLDQGYSQAKFIAERMVNRYATMSPNGKMAVLRVGQIAGPRKGNGTWNVREWLPSLLLSSKFLGAVPATIAQRVDWIPVDALATIVTEIMDHVGQCHEDGGQRGAVVYNVVNPAATTWHSLLPAFKDIAPETVGVEAWVRRLEDSVHSSAHVLEQNPGVKLLDFLRSSLLNKAGEMRFVTDNLVKASSTAAALEPIGDADMRKLMKAWSAGD